jgi:cytochrome c oxidase cbb3-type subunit III
MKIFLCILCLALVAGCSKEQHSAPVPLPGDSVRDIERNGPAAALPVLTYEQAQGRDLYAKYCAICHGAGGAADGFNTYNLDPKPHDLSDSVYVSALSDDALTRVIKLGGRGVNKSVLMPAYGWTLGDDEISYLVSFIRVLARAAPERH